MYGFAAKDRQRTITVKRRSKIGRMGYSFERKRWTLFINEYDILLRDHSIDAKQTDGYVELMLNAWQLCP